MNIQKIDPYNQPEAVICIAKLYQEIFGGAPWNEGRLCPVCNTVFALSQEPQDVCPECRKGGKFILLTEYWPVAKILTDYYREMGKENAVNLIAQEDKKIIGFAWGYEIKADSDIDAYLSASGVHHVLKTSFFYIDEVAVHPKYQCKGIGKQLVREIITQQRRETVILRTMAHSQMHKLITSLGGSVIHSISANRVIMMLSN